MSQPCSTPDVSTLGRGPQVSLVYASRKAQRPPSPLCIRHVQLCTFGRLPCSCPLLRLQPSNTVAPILDVSLPPGTRLMASAAAPPRHLSATASYCLYLRWPQVPRTTLEPLTCGSQACVRMGTYGGKQQDLTGIRHARTHLTSLYPSVRKGCLLGQAHSGTHAAVGHPRPGRHLRQPTTVWGLCTKRCASRTAQAAFRASVLLINKASVRSARQIIYLHV